MFSSKILGPTLVLIGAACYGLLATVVKLAYNAGFTRNEVILAQFIIGIIGLLILNLLFTRKFQTPLSTESKRDSALKLMIAGTSLGLTSIFYYTSVQYIPVSIAIVLLMQTVWMGVVVDWIFLKKSPSSQKIIAAIVILVGTLFATNALENAAQINWAGIGWGLLSAVSYTISMYTTNRIATHFHPLRRTLWMLLGGFCVILVVAYPVFFDGFNVKILGNYGLYLALFGTILPPILFSVGMPSTGVGLGSILSSVEIPVSVAMAYFILHEEIAWIQWTGIVLILIAVIWMNLPKKKL